MFSLFRIQSSSIQTFYSAYFYTYSKMYKTEPQPNPTEVYFLQIINDNDLKL